MEQLLETCKKALRMNHNELDDEILDEIEACLKDLEISGIAPNLIKEDDPLIKQAVKIYVKANFGYDNPESDKLKESYNLLKQHLAIAYATDEGGENAIP